MANKKTKVEVIQNIIDKYSVDGEDKSFLLHEIELINKRNSYKSDKPTKTQVENAVRKEGILSVMAEGAVYTATDVATLMGEDWKPQRAAALLTQMVKDGKVVRAEVKRRAYFALAGTDIEAVLASANADKAE